MNAVSVSDVTNSQWLKTGMSYYFQIHLPFSFPATSPVPKLFASTSLLVCLLLFSVKSDSVCHLVCLSIQKVNAVGRGKAAPTHFLYDTGIWIIVCSFMQN